MFHHPDRSSEVRFVVLLLIELLLCLSSCKFCRAVAFLCFELLLFVYAILLSLVYRVVNIVVFCLSSCKLAKILLFLSESGCSICCVGSLPDPVNTQVHISIQFHLCAK